MEKPIYMPQVGQDLETGILTEWRIKVGDEVKKGDIVAVVTSDKASFEVEAFESGYVLKLLYEEGDQATVFEPIAYLVDKRENVVKHHPSEIVKKEIITEEKINVQGKQRQPISHNGKILSTPSARRIAREHHIDISLVKSSGSNGRIIKQDVLDAIGKTITSDKAGIDQVSTFRAVDSEPVLEDEIPFSNLRQKIAERLVRSKQTIPHFYLFMDVDVTDVLVWRSQFNKKNTCRITINDMIIKATAATLAQFPKLNSHLAENKLIVRKNINIGIAVSLVDGLLVPVISRVNEKNIEEISTEARELAREAKMGHLKSAGTATFSISNLGMFSVDRFLPIINPPEVAILGVGKISKRVVPLEMNTFGIRDYLTLSLVCDHRAIDGSYAANFLNQLKEYLENFTV